MSTPKGKQFGKTFFLCVVVSEIFRIADVSIFD